MAYLGNAPARSFISFERQVFTIVNSQTAYTLDHSVNNENDIRLVVNNIVQEPGSGKAYTASGTTLTLSAALTNGTDEMYCVVLGRAVATNAPGAGSVGASQLASDAVTAAKLNDDIISGQTALGAPPADTDEFLISDAGTIKRVDYSYLKGGTNTPAFEANLSAEQSASNDTYTKMDFDEEVFDTDGAYDHTTNQRFTVPSGQAGKYHIYSNVVLGSGSNTDLVDAKVAIYKNGSVYSRTIMNNETNYTRYTQLSIASTMVLSVGDYVEIYAQVNRASGSVEFRAQNREATFGGYKIIE